jgi:CBS domain-containing protein
MAQLRGMQLREVMSRPVITVDPGAAVKEAARLLAEHATSTLPMVGAVEDPGPNRRLAESVALAVPGVLDVRFSD